MGSHDDGTVEVKEREHSPFSLSENDELLKRVFWIDQLSPLQ